MILWTIVSLVALLAFAELIRPFVKQNEIRAIKWAISEYDKMIAEHPAEHTFEARRYRDRALRELRRKGGAL